ncbi:ABC transporter ATP-binding protein [Stieleria sp. TO1_6]|uniref:ABC transporter ATP-binding protein n=1 Tax=Stieleria tagensis TaxID=2956795 RepID=UPI00209B36F8|nr:ABC transporter ATP-binding protein [Stieleria tagensis]MCO8121058.1 ABC transporter ATP-binding protein [Stieleria tagensis]
MSTLSAKSLTFGFDSNHVVLRDLSLSLRRGEVLVLLGGNGSGKTTLLRMLAGQLSPDSGNVVLDDVPIDQLSRREIAKRLAMMPQSELCETAFTVREMVRLGRAAHRGWWMPLTDEDEQAVEEALAATGMQKLADRNLTTLSGGQWRRSILARSLAQQASILLLDEPTNGLDLKHQYDCLSQIRDLVKQKNLIAVLALHDLNQTAMFADRIALLSGQKVMAIGDCWQVLTAERIEQAYGIQATIVEHPVHGTPLVVPVGPTVPDFASPERS